MGNKKNFSESSGKNITEQEQQPEEATGKQESEAPEEEQAAESPEAIAKNAGEVAKLIQEKDEYYDRLLRTQADFDNYRKRVQKEQANLLRYGAENALREILPVVDNLERAVDSARKHGEVNSHLEGIELILAQIREAMGRLGVKPIETVGEPFDPNKHDALIRVHAPDAPEGAVVEEIRKGYYLHDKVLRPAQVTVGTHEQVGDS
jgi:molecular chaperone GrpE